MGLAPFKEILAAAEARLGADSVRKRLPEPKSDTELRAVGDDRYLSRISFRVFSAGLKHSMVEGKWPAFEEVFMGFDPLRVRALSDEALEALMAETRIIRHWGKIKSVRHNASALCDIAAESGGFGAYLADWPGERIVELWDDIAKRLAHMGGNSGPYFLRMAGKDSFVMTPDVIRGLGRWAGLEGSLKGKRDRASAQAAFNDWASESGRPLSEISMIVALSTD